MSFSIKIPSPKRIAQYLHPYLHQFNQKSVITKKAAITKAHVSFPLTTDYKIHYISKDALLNTSKEWKGNSIQQYEYVKEHNDIEFTEAETPYFIQNIDEDSIKMNIAHALKNNCAKIQRYTEKTEELYLRSLSDCLNRYTVKDLSVEDYNDLSEENNARISIGITDLIFYDAENEKVKVN